MTTLISDVAKPPRIFLPESFQPDSWSLVEPFVQILESEPIHSLDDLTLWLKKWSELECVIGEERAWRFIRMTCNTDKEELRDAFNRFIQEVMPPFAIWTNKLEQKLVQSPFFTQLPTDPFLTLVRSVKNQLALFREENIPIQTEAATLSREFDQVAGSLFIEWEGKKYTLQQAGSLLESPDSQIREAVGKKIIQTRFKVREQLDGIFSRLISLRTQIAKNAGFPSFSSYMHQAMDRFDYSSEDCFAFHSAIESRVKPIYQQIMGARKKELGLSCLRQWDLMCDTQNRSPLRPFDGEKELLEKTIQLFDRMNPGLADCIRKMKEKGYLDLESRLGKAPGGYNYGLPETGIPFIFMNAAGMQGDVTTMLHEAGHAFHSFSTAKIPISRLKDFPSEVAELASMSMELISLDFYDVFYVNPEDAKRAKRDQLNRIITLLPWIAAIDAFQHWVYENPNHDTRERAQAWSRIYKRFHGDLPEWEGMEEELGVFWQKQGHVFDMPFYYIEYGIAQLGAVAVWKNYRKDPAKGLNQYLDALSLGYTRTIPEIYQAAGIQFDFSEQTLGELCDFLLKELQLLA